MSVNPLPVLVINAGSSSLKFRLYDMTCELPLVTGIVERIGEADAGYLYQEYMDGGKIREHSARAPVADHAAGLERIFGWLEGGRFQPAIHSLHVIGHRVVHGGDAFQAPALIDAQVIETIRAMTSLAPLHNPPNLAGIEAARRRYPRVPQVAVFDTAFFGSLPPQACHYAIPDAWYRRHHIRRYGFHGISHQHVAGQAAAVLRQPLDTLRLITLHLGNGASAAAIRNGICIDTSMGMTPLEGLIMGTRCGDLDPAVPFYLARTLGMPLADIEDQLNHASGMQGLCGASDMREVHRLADQGDERARLALEMYCYRIAKYIGAYTIALGGLDALVFTGGVGENDAAVRQSVCAELSPLGTTLDARSNQGDATGNLVISGRDSRVKVLVIPANEELEIARQSVACIKPDAGK